MSSSVTANDSYGSFEAIEPIMSSPPNSMSIVTISADETNPVMTVSDHQIHGMSAALQMSGGDGECQQLLNTDELDSRRMESIGDSLPKYEELCEQQVLFANKMSDSYAEELRDNESVHSMSDNLSRIEEHVKSCSQQMDNILTNNLELYLKELRDENEKLKAELEKNNTFMKQQLKNLHEWHAKNQEISEDTKRMAEENGRLVAENAGLADRVSQLEGLAGLKLVEELSTEVATLRSKCDQMSSYEKLNVPSELKAQELSSQVIESQMKMDAMADEMTALKRQVSDSSAKLEEMAAMRSQLMLFERDFKLEEMSKLAALKEVTELEATVEELKERLADTEERLEKGAPTVDLKAAAEELPVGRHHRRHRHSRKLSKNPIPVLNVGAVLRGFKQYKTTTDHV